MSNAELLDNVDKLDKQFSFDQTSYAMKAAMFTVGGGVLGFAAGQFIKPEKTKPIAICGASFGLGACNYEVKELLKDNKQRSDDMLETVEAINRQFAAHK